MSLIIKNCQDGEGGLFLFDLKSVKLRVFLLPGVFIRGAMLVSSYIIYRCYARSAHIADKKCV